MTQEEKRTYMITAPVEKLICKMAIPTIISMLISNLYNMVDTYFVGGLETQATAAIGISFSLMAIIQALGFTFGHGSGVSMSNELGKDHVEVAQSISVTAFFHCAVTGVLFAVIGNLFLEPVCYILGSSETILPFAKDYLRIILIGAPVMMCSIVLNNQMRYQGNAIYAMVGIVSGAVINIGLDYLFIDVWELGVSGAATATVISQSISLVLLIVGTTRPGNVHLNFRRIDFHFRVWLRIVKSGLPSLFRQGLASVASASLNHACLPFGDEVVAGMTIVNRLTMFINSVMIGFGQGFQPVCGFNYGAAKYDRVKKGYYFCIRFGTVVLLGIGVIFVIFAPQIVIPFQKDPLVQEFAAFALRFTCAVLPLGAATIATNMMLQACGRSLSAVIASSAKQGIFFLPLIFTLPLFCGKVGIAVAQPIADVCALLLAIPLGIHFIHHMSNKE